MKLFSVLLTAVALLTGVNGQKQCCSEGVDPVGIPYSTLSGRVCRTLGDDSFRFEPLVYTNNSLTWRNLYGCSGDAEITYRETYTEFKLNPTSDNPDPRCEGAVFKLYSKIRDVGDFDKASLVLGDGTSCGNGPFQMSCETRPCCKTGCEDPNADSGGGGGSALCFSESATVQVQSSGNVVREVSMQDLKVGDSVQTSSGFQPVYSFGHYDLKSSTDFLMVHTNQNEKNALEITKDHLLFLQDQDTPITAGSIKVGDRLQTEDKEGATVTKIGSVRKQGLYAPLTASGTVVVDGILASSYVTLQGSQDDAAFVHVQGVKTWVSQQQFVHLLLAPHRLLCTGLFPALGETYTRNGMPLWIDFGIQYIQTAHGQNFVVESIMLLLGLALGAACFLLESLFGASFAPLAVAALVYYYKNVRRSTGGVKKVSV